MNVYSSRALRRLTIVAFLTLACSIAYASGTVTFTADDSGTFPRTVELDRQTQRLRVDLSGLPAGAEVFRAELVLNPITSHLQKRPFEPTRVSPEGRPDEPLEFVAPRFMGLDALEPVRAAVAAGEPLVLVVENTCRGVRRLEVSYVGADVGNERPPVVTGVSVAHRGGQSLLTFGEPELEPLPRFQTGADVRHFRDLLGEKHPGVRFRIWRSSEPISERSMTEARLVGECGPLTAWNDTYWQGDTNKRAPVRYRMTDGGEPVPWGTGVYAHNPREAGKAYYAVTVAVDGREDFSRLGPGSATARPVDETVGPGEPVLQWIETPQEWMYRRAEPESHLVRMIYTRWEAWPRASRPNRPIDYLVVTSRDPQPEQMPGEPHYRAYRVEPAPVGLHLHCWGGSLNGGYGWWYNAHRGAVLIASNQIPYDWWTGYHEALGTAKTWGDGRVRPFTMDRMFAFLDWAATQHRDAPEIVRGDWPALDLTRVFTAGSSMGGSGAPMYAVRHGGRIAWSLGWVGVHVPEMSPGFQGSYENSYGPRHPAVTMPDGRTSPWDHFSDVWYLRRHPAEETGMIIASNGKDDGGIGWPQALEFARALQETRRPHIFNWGLSGHGTRTIIGQNFDLDIRTDQTLPAFSHCSLDDDPGTAKRKTDAQIEAEKKRQEAEVAAGKRDRVKVDPYDGDPEGALNAYLRWETDDVIDQPDAWAMTVILLDTAPADQCRVDLTPRRCQQFRTPPGKTFHYTVTDPATGTEPTTGQVTADEDGLLTLQQIPLRKGRNRVRIVTAR